MAIAVQQQVGWLHVAVDQVRSVHIVQGLQQLVYDILLMDLLQDASADNGMQVSLCRDVSVRRMCLDAMNGAVRDRELRARFANSKRCYRPEVGVA